MLTGGWRCIDCSFDTFGHTSCVFTVPMFTFHCPFTIYSASYRLSVYYYCSDLKQLFTQSPILPKTSKHFFIFFSWTYSLNKTNTNLVVVRGSWRLVHSHCDPLHLSPRYLLYLLRDNYRQWTSLKVLYSAIVGILILCLYRPFWGIHLYCRDPIFKYYSMLLLYISERNIYFST